MISKHMRLYIIAVTRFVLVLLILILVLLAKQKDFQNKYNIKD